MENQRGVELRFVGRQLVNDGPHYSLRGYWSATAYLHNQRLVIFWIFQYRTRSGQAVENKPHFGFPTIVDGQQVGEAI
jgi:hypothetical protein